MFESIIVAAVKVAFGEAISRIIQFLVRRYSGIPDQELLHLVVRTLNSYGNRLDSMDARMENFGREVFKASCIGGTTARPLLKLVGGKTDSGESGFLSVIDNYRRHPLPREDGFLAALDLHRSRV